LHPSATGTRGIVGENKRVLSPRKEGPTPTATRSTGQASGRTGPTATSTSLVLALGNQGARVCPWSVILLSVEHGVDKVTDDSDSDEEMDN